MPTKKRKSSIEEDEQEFTDDEIEATQESPTKKRLSSLNYVEEEPEGTQFVRVKINVSR